MAKKAAEKINKTQLILTYAKENPTEKGKAISEALTKQTGAKISAQYVSMILSKARKSSGKGGKRGRKANVAGDTRGNGFAEAIVFIKAVGSLDAAKAVLADLESLKAVL